MDDILSHNLRCIEQGFTLCGFEPERRWASGMQLYVSTEHVVLSCIAMAAAEGQWIVVIGSHPARIVPARRAAVAEAMARINYQQIVGNFEIDLGDGEMRYRAGHALTGEELTPDVVQRLVGTVLYTWDRFHGALMSVAYGGSTPEDAVCEVLAPPVASPADSSAADESGDAPVDVDAVLEELGLTGPISPPAPSVPDPIDPDSPEQADRLYDTYRTLHNCSEDIAGDVPVRRAWPGLPLFPAPSPVSTREAWIGLHAALAACLESFEEDDLLVISRKAGAGFVQFAGQGAHGMRVEAVSNAFLPPGEQLPSYMEDEMLTLGWCAPTFVPAAGEPEPTEGSCNFYVDAGTPIPARALARLAAMTLRRVYGVRHPGELQYKAWNARSGVEIRVPALRLKRETV